MGRVGSWASWQLGELATGRVDNGASWELHELAIARVGNGASWSKVKPSGVVARTCSQIE